MSNVQPSVHSLNQRLWHSKIEFHESLNCVLDVEEFDFACINWIIWLDILIGDCMGDVCMILFSGLLSCQFCTSTINMFNRMRDRAARSSFSVTSGFAAAGYIKVYFSSSPCEHYIFVCGEARGASGHSIDVFVFVFLSGLFDFCLIIIYFIYLTQLLDN